MQYDTYLYLILHPNNALVASQLDPSQFARHYTTGSSRHYHGKVVFAQLESGYRHEYFPIDEILKSVAPHEDGRPKATKFISSYRTLEHVDLTAIHRVHLASEEGDCIELSPGEFRDQEVSGDLRLFAEITPLRMLVLSEHGFEEFGRYITAPENPKSAPKQFYTQIDIDIEVFVSEFEANPFRPSPIPSVHPSTLRDAFVELQSYPEKHFKGIALDARLDQISYRLITNGFMFSSNSESKFFPMPPQEAIEKASYKFWRAM